MRATRLLAGIVALTTALALSACGDSADETAPTTSGSAAAAGWPDAKATQIPAATSVRKER